MTMLCISVPSWFVQQLCWIVEKKYKIKNFLVFLKCIAHLYHLAFQRPWMFSLFWEPMRWHSKNPKQRTSSRTRTTGQSRIQNTEYRYHGYRIPRYGIHHSSALYTTIWIKQFSMISVSNLTWWFYFKLTPGGKSKLAVLLCTQCSLLRFV